MKSNQGMLVMAGVLAAVAALLVSTMHAKPASAHLNGSPPPSVDAVDKMVWYLNFSSYSNVVTNGAAKWSALAGRPNIAVGDQRSFTLDLADGVSNCNTTVVASWNYYTSNNNGFIRFNPCLMDPLGSAKRQIVATHEYGHALDFDHPQDLDANDNFCNISVMWWNVDQSRACGQVGEVMSHDSFDFSRRW